MNATHQNHEDWRLVKCVFGLRTLRVVVHTLNAVGPPPNFELLAARAGFQAGLELGRRPLGRLGRLALITKGI